MNESSRKYFLCLRGFVFKLDILKLIYMNILHSILHPKRNHNHTLQPSCDAGQYGSMANASGVLAERSFSSNWI
jgi:hypothetical protein